MGAGMGGRGGEEQRRWCWEAGKDGTLALHEQKEVVGEEPNSVESGELAAFYSKIKAQEPSKRISRKLSRRFHASVIHHL